MSPLEGAVLLSALSALLLSCALLAYEKRLVTSARKKLSLVILVNGTRGKSTVTRMLHELLRQASGFGPVFAKTSGSEARLLLPEGGEERLRRLAGADIREMRGCLLRAAASGAKTIVFECSAVTPEVQKVLAAWLRPDITVITNVRSDHQDALGSPEEAARVFASLPPPHTALVTPCLAFLRVWEEAAARRDLRLFLPPVSESRLSPGDALFPENLSCLSCVAGLLGLEEGAAEKAGRNYRPDPGEFTLAAWKAGGRTVFFADARAANDAASTALLLEAAEKTLADAAAARVFLLVNREDRPDRLFAFAEYLAACRRPGDGCVVLGASPAAFRRRLSAAGFRPVYLGAGERSPELDAALLRAAGEHKERLFVFALGNYAGAGALVTRWLAAKKARP